jgi:hypothetical protein
VVGVAGFEPTTSSSRTMRATRLRYTPITEVIIRFYSLSDNASAMGTLIGSKAS